MKRKHVAAVFRWELLKHVKSPVFLLFTFLIPLIMVAASFLPAFFMERIATDETDLLVLDETNELAPLIVSALDGSRYQVTVLDETREQAQQRLEAGEIDGFLYITEETLATGRMQLFQADSMDLSRGDLEQQLQPVFTQYRLQVSGISPEEFGAILIPASVQVLTISGEEQGVVGFIVPMVSGIVLLISLLFSGQILMQSVIKEKRNRIIEILLSSLSATELLAGKILAFGALALIQVAIWISGGLAVASRFISLSDLGMDWGQMAVTFPYFVLGFLMLSTIFAATAATMKDAESGSQAHGLVIMVPILPLFLATPIIMAPNNLYIRILSFIPIFTPGTMLLRLSAGNIPIWEIAGTILVLLAGTVLMLRLGARIYEGSVLKYDTAASLREIFRMARKTP